jgi:putative transposase
VKLAAVSTVCCHPALARHHSTRKEASRNIFAYIEGFYHRTRRHPAVGDISPIEMAPKAA